LVFAAAMIPAVAIIATAAETLFGLLLILGWKTRITALLSGVLLTTFALTMTMALGVKAPLDLSVFSAAGGALLLATSANFPFSLDELVRRNKQAESSAPGGSGANHHDSTSGSAKFAIRDCLEASSCLGVRALGESIQLLHKRIIQLNQSRWDIFFEVVELGGTGNRQHHRWFPQQPRDCDLSGSGLQSLRDKLQWSARSREIAGCEGEPWDKPDIFAGTVIQHLLVLSLN
jgi:hypothetical protein